MSHNVHPYAHRLVTLRDWKSRWFDTGKQYVANLRADVLLREFLEKRLRGKYVSSIEFERGRKATRLIIRTSRPGVLIGRNGDEAKKLRAAIMKFMGKRTITLPEDFQVDVVEVANADANAKIVAQMVAEMLEKRMPFRRATKQTAEKVMAVKGVKGVRILLAGRLGGAEMARREEVKQGGIPLQFIRADIDYAQETARLPYGGVGIKVWIYHGDSLENTK
ncbi:MAG: small subunit ribosomal protein S3 [Planctomycetota bacterium]|jgi:small subunit ribosomal protein S3